MILSVYALKLYHISFIQWSAVSFCFDDLMLVFTEQFVETILIG